MYLCVCVCGVRYVSSHVSPFVAWKLTIGLVWSPHRFPCVLPACLLFFCLPACLSYSLQDLLLFFGEAYKSKIFCNLPPKGNCGQIRLSTCDISNVRARVAQKGCPVQNWNLRYQRKVKDWYTRVSPVLILAEPSVAVAVPSLESPVLSSNLIKCFALLCAGFMATAAAAAAAAANTYNFLKRNVFAFMQHFTLQPETLVVVFIFVLLFWLALCR